MTKRFKLVYIDEDDEWSLYDSVEEKWYDIDLTEYLKESKRIERNHKNLHEKYEKLERKYKEIVRENSKIKGNTHTAKLVYENLKSIFEQ